VTTYEIWGKGPAGNEKLDEFDDLKVPSVWNNGNTAHIIKNALPIRSKVNKWGDEIYFSIPVNAGLEKDDTMPKGVKPVVLPGLTQVYAHPILKRSSKTFRSFFKIPVKDQKKTEEEKSRIRIKIKAYDNKIIDQATPIHVSNVKKIK